MEEASQPLAEEVMRASYEVCTPETVVPDVLYLLKRYDYDDLIVVNNMREKKIIGVVHAESVSDDALQREGHPFSLQVKSLMDHAPPFIDRKAPVEECLGLMNEEHWRILPVTGETGECVGVVLKADLLKSGS